MVLLVFASFLSCTGNDTSSTTHKPSKPHNCSLEAKAQHYTYMRALDSAFYYYNEAKKHHLKNNDSIQAAKNIALMAEVQLTAGDYFGAEKTILENLPFIKKQSDKKELVKAYTFLAHVYKHLFDHKNALLYFEKAQDVSTDSLEKLNILHNIARVHIELGNNLEAIGILQGIKESEVAKKSPSTYAYIIDRLGFAMLRDNNSGLEHLLAALEIRKTHNDIEGLFYSYQHISEYYDVHGIPATAKEYAKKTYDIALKLREPEKMLQALSCLVTISTGDELKFYSNEYITYNTALKKTRTAHKNSFNDIIDNDTRYETAALKKNETQDRALLMQISSDHNKLLLISLVFTIFSSIMVYYLVRSRHRKERFMESYSTETRLAKKVHDEIANEIYGTINDLASDEDISVTDKEKLLSRLDSIYLMTKNISRETNNIDTGYEYPEHLKMMLNAYSGYTVNVIIKGIADINWDSIDAIKKIATYRSLQELMVNMKKHSQASLVVVDFTIDNKKIVINYTDNGVGATQEKLLTKNGLQNIESRMTSIDGAVHFDTGSGKGFHITLTYPLYTPYVQKNFNNRRH